MKRAFYLVVVLGLLVQQGIWFAPAAVQASSPAAPLLQSGDEPVAQPTDEPLAPPPDVAAADDITVPYPEPSQPIPYNKPGYPSKMGIDTRLRLASTYQPWSARVSAMSVEEATQALAYGPDYDPFIGNYTLVNWDNVGVVSPGTDNAQRFRTWKGYEDPGNDNLQALQDVTSSGTGAGFTRAGDINSDGIDEVVTVTGGKVQVGNLSGKRFSKGAPAIASPRAGVTWQFVRGYDDQLWMLRDVDGQASMLEGPQSTLVGPQWKQLGGNLASSPTASSPAPGRVDVLMLQADGHVWRCELYGDNPSCAWRPTIDDWGAPPRGSFVGEPVMTAASDKIHDVFVRGSDNTLWHRAYRSGWGDWKNLGGYITSSPAATLRDGQIDVVAAGYDGAIWHMSGNGATWSAWERLPGDLQFRSAPAIVAPGAGMLSVYAVDPNLDAEDIAHPLLRLNRFQSGNWEGWIDSPASATGAEPASAPAATVERNSSDVRMNYRGADGMVYLSTRNWLDFDAQPLLGMWSQQHTVSNLSTFELGHFMPDGRMQALNYRLVFGSGQTRTKDFRLESYQFAGGSTPVLKGSDSITLTNEADSGGYWFLPAVGDYDGNGEEELALLLQSNGTADLYILKIDESGKLSSEKAPKLKITNAVNIWFNLTSGDYDGDGMDELAVLKMPLAATGETTDCDLKVYGVGGDFSLDPPVEFTDPECNLNKTMATTSGNFIGEGEGETIKDEIAYAGVTFVTSWFGDYYFLRRWVVQLKDGKLVNKDYQQEPLFDYIVTHPEPKFFAVSIAGANLQRQNPSEPEKMVVFLEYGKIDFDIYVDIPGARILYAYEIDDQGHFTKKTTVGVDSGLDNTQALAAFVSGNLSGDGLRVAKPTYRLAANVGKLVAWVSAPPKIYDVNYNNPNNPDDPHVVNPESLATITLTSEAKKEITVEAKSHWNLDAELTAQAGDDDVGPRVSASLKGSVGQDFSNVAGSSQTVSQNSVITSPVDQWVYALTDFQMFEYPVIDGETGDQWNMSVTTPRLGSVGMSVSGLNCDVLLNPGHELNNLLSYASVPEELPGFKDNKYLGTNNSYDASSGGEFSALFTNSTDSTFSKSTDWSVTAGIEAGYSGGVGSISASLEGTYSEGYAATESVSTSNSIGVGGRRQQLGPADAIYYQHKIKPYFYWTGDKTLVLDYVVEPSNTTWWNNPNGWLLPDLAFVRPRKGLPCSPAQGQNQDDLSPDITFDNATPLADSPVKVTALVHNFSNQSASIGVTVKFYRGDPALGGTELCSETTSLSGPRSEGRDVRLHGQRVR